MKVEYDFFVGYKDIEKDLKIKNPAMLTFFENMAGMHANMVDDGLRATLETAHATWLLVSWNVNVLRRPEYGETVRASTWVCETKRVYSHREFELRSADGELLVVAASKWIHVDVEKGAPVRCEKELADRYGSLEETNFGTEWEVKIPEPEAEEFTLEKQIEEEWIDMNYHMNNTHYLVLAKQALPEDMKHLANSDNFQVLYRKEIKLGDRVKCYVSTKEKGAFVTVKSQDEATLHAIIKFG